MKYFRHAHLIYAGFFALCALTTLRLGTGVGFHIVFKTLLAAWLFSTMGLIFRKRWAWFGSVTCVALVWLLLAVNLAAAVRTDPGHSDYAQDLSILVLFFFLPVTASLFLLWTSRSEYRNQSTSTGMPITESNATSG